MNSVLHLKYTRVKKEEHDSQEAVGKKGSERSSQSGNGVRGDKNGSKDRSGGSSGASGSGGSESGSTAGAGEADVATSLFGKEPGGGPFKFLPRRPKPFEGGHDHYSSYRAIKERVQSAKWRIRGVKAGRNFLDYVEIPDAKKSAAWIGNRVAKQSELLPESDLAEETGPARGRRGRFGVSMRRISQKPTGPASPGGMRNSPNPPSRKMAARLIDFHELQAGGRIVWDLEKEVRLIGLDTTYIISLTDLRSPQSGSLTWSSRRVPTDCSTPKRPSFNGQGQTRREDIEEAERDEAVSRLATSTPRLTAMAITDTDPITDTGLTTDTELTMAITVRYGA